MKSILKHASIYSLFQNMIGASKTRRVLSKEYIKSDETKRVLDLCCGTCDILPYLEFQEYVGVDISDQYIEHCEKTFAEYNNVCFIDEDINTYLANNKAEFDIILFLGGMHHLNDDELLNCLQHIKIALKPGGRLVTLDGCFEDDISPIAKWIMSNDRGEYVRTKENWIKIFTTVFEDYEYSTRRDLYRIPYNLIIFYR